MRIHVCCFHLHCRVVQWASKPPKEIQQLLEESRQIKADVASIKSIQLELVRHSKLTRKLIKVEKELERVKSEQTPIVDKWRTITKYARVCV